ncbi:sulfite exporter TauE/SafE family protein [Hydrocarboniphaga sp.]|uniref:sulfite exporter TauE/SafE family protein n=1 Tax=Hydrocarboniphaga sp. TaxID=2033016 RepID=UPI003D13BB7E
MSILLGIVVGLVLGLTGAGGSILAVPLLMAGLAWPLTQAAPIALLAVAAAAALGTYLAWRRHYVRYRAATLMSIVGTLTSPLGLHAAERLPAAALSLVFAVILGIAAIRLLLQSLDKGADGDTHLGRLCRYDPVSGRLVWTWLSGSVLAAIGALTGFLSGLLGVGGGFFIVPALRAATELTMQAAIATSLMTIALTSLGTVAIAAIVGRDIPVLVALPFVLGSLLGMAAGRWLAPKLPGVRLQQGFALLMLLVAAGMALHGLA